MPTLYTIGHSNRTLFEFIELLYIYQITDLIDVRTIPHSQHNPWFNRQELQIALTKENITYKHFPGLGGLRKSQKDSINLGWRNQSFRGYADYMQTKDFYCALKELNHALKKNHQIVIMCAEAVPWRCHRTLIADTEIIHGIKVCHIINKNHIQSHYLTSFAVVDRTKRPIKIFYPNIGPS